MRAITFFLSCFLASVALSGEPPELIAPGLISTTNGEYSPTYDASRNELVFMRRTPGLFDYTLYVARETEDGWSAPEELPFSGTHRDGGASFSPDGQRLLFDSRRPVAGAAPGSINLWRVARSESGWTVPAFLEAASVNADDEPEPGRDEFGPIETADGTVVFYSFRQPVRGGSHYTLRDGDDLQRATDLPDPSADTFVGYLTLSADGKLAVIEGRSRSGGDTDLFYSCKVESGWTDPKPISAANSTSGDGTPYLTSDGQWLLFSSGRPAANRAAGTANLYRITVASLGIDCAR